MHIDEDVRTNHTIYSWRYTTEKIIPSCGYEDVVAEDKVASRLEAALSGDRWSAPLLSLFISPLNNKYDHLKFNIG